MAFGIVFACICAVLMLKCPSFAVGSFSLQCYKLSIGLTVSCGKLFDSGFVDATAVKTVVVKGKAPVDPECTAHSTMHVLRMCTTSC
jgi:hypothetical protein